MENNVKDFLESIQELKNEKFEVNKISNGETFKCSPLSFKKQKQLISTVTEGTVGILKFQKTLNEIIIENTDHNDWRVIDKIPVILKMRMESLGGFVKNNDGEFDISNIQILKKTDTPLTKMIKGVVEVALSVPKITDENAVLDYAINILKKEGDKDVGKILGNVYTFEIVKFINFVKFGDKVLNFVELSIKDRIAVVEQLPLSINKEIVKFIESIKNLDRSQTKIIVDGEERTFDIDVTFFDN